MKFIDYKLHLEKGLNEDLRDSLEQERVASVSTATALSKLKEALAREQTRIVTASLVN